MEMNQELVAVQDDLKLLKGEIKNILKELRSAVLSEDNPFTNPAAPPTFKAVGRGDATDAEELGGAREQTEESSFTEQAVKDDESVAGVPTTPPAGAREATPARQAPQAPDGPSSEPVPLHGSQPVASNDDAGPAKADWSMLTIASLAAWSEDALKSLGPRRFHTVLELACFADLIPADVKEILGSMAESVEEREADREPMHINDCLVVLHQLEAIMQGDKIRNLPRRRRRRSRIR